MLLQARVPDALRQTERVEIAEINALGRERVVKRRQRRLVVRVDVAHPRGAAVGEEKLPGRPLGSRRPFFRTQRTAALATGKTRPGVARIAGRGRGRHSMSHRKIAVTAKGLAALVPGSPRVAGPVAEPGREVPAQPPTRRISPPRESGILVAADVSKESVCGGKSIGAPVPGNAAPKDAGEPDQPIRRRPRDPRILRRRGVVFELGGTDERGNAIQEVEHRF